METDGHTSAEARDLYNKLDQAIQDYFKQVDMDLGDYSSGDYIAAWGVVVNQGNLERFNGYAGGYGVQTMPRQASPHAIKGLFNEGIEWVESAVYTGDEEDED